MNSDKIKKFNEELQKLGIYEQGIFTEPNYIPIHIKEPVIYRRDKTGGINGGSCWEDSDPQSYSETVDEEWYALDKFLIENYPKITYVQYKAVNKLVHTNEETEHEYYGNCTDYLIKYIILSELEELLKIKKVTK